MKDSPEISSGKLDRSECIICVQSPRNAARDKVIEKPTKGGLNSILQVAQLRKDDVLKATDPFKKDILNFDIKVRFHEKCRASYTSKSSLAWVARKRDDDPSVSTSEGASSAKSRRISRGEASVFNIREHCFLCGQGGTKKMKLSQITTGSGKSAREKVLTAAEERSDEVVRLRMLSYPDLFAYDAKYHRTCLSHYISRRNIDVISRKHDRTESTNECDGALDVLRNELRESLLSGEKTVAQLSTLRDRLLRILSEHNVENPQYSSWKLKDRRVSSFQDEISFVSRPGKSDFVCSSSLTVGEVLSQAMDLQEALDEGRECTGGDELNKPTSNYTEREILHMAAGILQKEMAVIKGSVDSYLSCDDLNQQNCRAFVPPPLFNFFLWLFNSNAHETAFRSDGDTGYQEDIRILSVCHTVIAQSPKIITPMTLGLAIQMHHDIGSRQAVEVLNKLGFCVSYDEVRRFQTSLALNEFSKDDATYVPQGLVSVSDAGNMIYAAIDNFDQNEDTLDGKSTTHAMAVVVYQKTNVLNTAVEIPRTKQKAVSDELVLQAESSLVPYKNP